MLGIKRYHILIATALAAVLFSGCGGGGGSGSDGNGSSTTSGSTSSASQTALTMEAVECLNAANLEAGRTIQLRSVINSSGMSDKNSTLIYMIEPDGNENNSTGTYLVSDYFVPAQGADTRDIIATLPVSLQSGSYRIIATIDDTAFGNSDFNLSALDKELTAKSDALFIQANDGKPDIEITSIKISATDSESSKIRSMENEPSAILTFEVGVVDDNVILNSRGISFNGVLSINDYIAEAKNFRVSACIDFDGSCKPIEMYSVDDTNQTHYDAYMRVESAKPYRPKDIIFTGVIRKELLNDITTAALKNSEFSPTIKVTVDGIEESGTQDLKKNSIETAVKFTPVVLSRENIDNTFDRVALALSNYKLSMKSYLKDIKAIDPAYPVEINSSGFSLFETGQDFQLNNLIKNITLQEQDSQEFIDGKIRFEPVRTPGNISLIPTIRIPEPTGVNKQNDPINNIRPVNSMIQELSMGEDISPVLLGAHVNDLSKETVKSKVFKKPYKLATMINEYAGLRGGLLGMARFDKNGVVFLGTADMDAYILNGWYQIVGIEAISSTWPVDLDETGFRFSFSFLNNTVYEYSKYITEEEGVSDSAATDLKQKVQENIETLETMKGDLLSYHDGKGWHDAKKEGGTFYIAFIPIAYEYGVMGRMGVKWDLDIKSIGRVDAGITPYAHFEGYGEIGPGFSYHGINVSIGVEGRLYLIHDTFRMGGGAGIKFVAGDSGVTSYIGELFEFILNDITPPYGGVYLYAKADLIGSIHKRIWEVDSEPETKVLLNKHQTLFKVDIE